LEKLKLGIVNSSSLTTAYGGVGPFIKNLDPFLSETFEVHYVTLPQKLHDLKLFPRRLTFSLYLLGKLKKLKKYDAILSHVPEGSYIISFTNVPLIHIFHGNFNAMAGSRFWYGKFFKNIFNGFEKRIIKTATLKYTVGNEREFIPKIMNPIFHNTAVKDPEIRSGFIFAGRLEKIKNVGKIIKVYSLLENRLMENNALTIAGKGSQEGELKALVSSLQLNDYVIFKGELSNNDLIEEVSTKKILLMASSHEGMPMAIAESLSVGVPAISTDTGDISRVIKNGFNGALCDIDFEFEIYAAKINLILKNYHFYANNALESSKIFKADNIAKNLTDDIYSIITANKNK
jgi:glycosyltransferase involved in cell wall biosynthesis